MGDAQSSQFTDGALDGRTVAEIQRKMIKQSGRNAALRFVLAKADGGTIAAWKSELNGILQVFNVRLDVITWISLIVPFQTTLALNTNITVSDIHRGVSKIIDGQVHSASVSHILPID